MAESSNSLNSPPCMGCGRWADTFVKIRDKRLPEGDPSHWMRIPLCGACSRIGWSKHNPPSWHGKHVEAELSMVGWEWEAAEAEHCHCGRWKKSPVAEVVNSG